MSSSRPRSAASTLYAAAQLAGFDAANGWPEELTTAELACMMAEEDWKSGNHADMWWKMLDDAAKAGNLVARFESADVCAMMPSVVVGWYYVKPGDFAAWLNDIGETPNDYVRAWLGEPAEIAGRREKQIAKILQTAVLLKYDPLKIPDGGKSKIKTECLKQPDIFTNDSFDHAWKAAGKAGKVCMANKEKYTA